METIAMLRHQTIENLASQHAEVEVDALIALWGHVAAQIILIVGEGGFDSLYARSLYLSQLKFLWLAADSPSVQADQRFAKLRESLQAQPQALANAANRLLLVTFTDILASLIGEHLTARILESAWGDSGAQIKADKEQNNAS